MDRLLISQVQHDRVAIARAIAVFACAVDGIDCQHPLALLGESTEVAGAFFGLDPAAPNDWTHVAQGGDEDLLHGQIGERERVGVGEAGVLPAEGDVVTAELPRERARPADGTRQLRREQLDQLVHDRAVRRG